MGSGSPEMGSAEMGGGDSVCAGQPALCIATAGSVPADVHPPLPTALWRGAARLGPLRHILHRILHRIQSPRGGCRLVASLTQACHRLRQVQLAFGRAGSLTARARGARAARSGFSSSRCWLPAPTPPPVHLAAIPQGRSPSGSPAEWCEASRSRPLLSSPAARCKAWGRTWRRVWRRAWSGAWSGGRKPHARPGALTCS